MPVDTDKVPLDERYVQLCAPGMMFANTWWVKAPHEAWSRDLENFAKIMRIAGRSRVGFRRFVTCFGPGTRKTFIDDGWVYIRGTKVPREDILSGKARDMYPDIPINDITKTNIRLNDCDCLWVEEFKKLWPLFPEDKIIT